MTQYPRQIQAAVLFDRLNPVSVEAIIKPFLAATTGRGQVYKVIEHKPGLFCRFFGGNVMITMEYIAGQAKAHLFETALGSAFTRMVNPGARSLVANHRSHILTNVHHGVIPPNTATMAFMAKLGLNGMLEADQTLGLYRERLAFCSTLALLAHQMGSASLVHWTGTDQLVTGDIFAKLAGEPAPSLLHIHPLLFNGGESPAGKSQIEIRTFGAAHFIGREVHFAANPMPWHESMGLIQTFLKVATTEHGYIVPDGDVFGDEENNVSCRVRHIAEGCKSGIFDGPLYRIELLYSRKHGFTAPDHFVPQRTFDDRSVPADIRADLGREHDTIVEDWQAKRQLAEGIGGRFMVKEPPADQAMNGFRRVFGRKKPSPDA